MTAPIPLYASCMDGIKYNALLAEMTPEEIRAVPRGVDSWTRAGWMEPDEAVEWKLRALTRWCQLH